MKFKPKRFRRSESLRIKVLRKTVNLKALKSQQIIIKLPTCPETLRQSIAYTSGSVVKTEVIQNSPKSTTNKFKGSESEEKKFNLKMMAANVKRKFGIERKIIEPTGKKPKPTGVKTGKGGKLIYI